MLQATELAKLQPAFRRLQTIPGIGPVISCTLMAAIGNGHPFDRGRSVAAWLGLVPRQNGSGGTTKLLGITKNGNRELRTLLIHGARTVLAHAKKHKDDKMGKWLLGLEASRGKNRAAVLRQSGSDLIQARGLKKRPYLRRRIYVRKPLCFRSKNARTTKKKPNRTNLIAARRLFGHCALNVIRH